MMCEQESKPVPYMINALSSTIRRHEFLKNQLQYTKYSQTS